VSSLLTVLRERRSKERGWAEVTISNYNKNNEKFAKFHVLWIEEAVRIEQHHREGRWTQSVAVGSKSLKVISGKGLIGLFR
jgi:hypothetical protein